MSIVHSYRKRNNLPEELIYADDNHFPIYNPTRKRETQRIANPILNQHSLKENYDMRELTEIKRSANYNKKKD